MIDNTLVRAATTDASDSGTAVFAVIAVGGTLVRARGLRG